MRKLCCMALVCGFVFAMSGCGRTAGQEPIAGDASGGLPEAAIEEALDKLDMEYIDMMLLHHPGAGDVEAYLAMERAVAEGKIRSLGLSNWYIEELEEFLPQVNITPALVQNEIHPYYQENTELFDFELTEEEMERINALDRNEKHDWY